MNSHSTETPAVTQDSVEPGITPIATDAAQIATEGESVAPTLATSRDELDTLPEPAKPEHDSLSSSSDLGLCDNCDDEPAVGMCLLLSKPNFAPKSYPYCAECMKEAVKCEREHLLRSMSVAEVSGRGWSWKTLSNERRYMDAEGEKPYSTTQSPETPEESWSKPSYIDYLKENFLTNPNLQGEPYRTIVREQITKLEAKLAEIVPAAKPKKEKPVATAIVKAEDDTLSSSPDLVGIPKMSADELHKEIIQTYVALGENVIMYQALVLDARRRMHRGEKVGGCLTWAEYADNYLRRDGESLPTCLRRLARAIEGHNPDTKHDGSKGRKLFASFNLSDEDRKKEAAIRKAAQIPKDKPVQKSHIKAYDAGWYAGHTANIRREKNNVANEEKYRGDKNREKAIKSALGLPLNATIEKHKMTEYLSVYRAGNDAGYDAGFREGQEQQMRYDLEHLPGTENLGMKAEKFEADSVPMPKGAL